MAQQLLVSISEEDYNVMCKLITQNEAKREHARKKCEELRGRKCVKHATPPKLNILAKIDAYNPQVVSVISDLIKNYPFNTPSG